jgi:serine/threonine-protein phosphatase 2A regulatory subunit B
MQAGRSFFSEIIASTSSLRFSACGRYMLSGDFMSLKLWDLPLAQNPAHS